MCPKIDSTCLQFMRKVSPPSAGGVPKHVSTSKCNDLHNSLYGNDPDDPEMPDLIPVENISDGEKTSSDRQVLVKAAIDHGIAASAEDVDMIIRTMSEDRMAMNIAASAKVDSDRVGMHTNLFFPQRPITQGSADQMPGKVRAQRCTLYIVEAFKA